MILSYCLDAQVGAFSLANAPTLEYCLLEARLGGGPFNPGFAFASGSPPDYVGTPGVTARINVIGNPYANVPANAFFNPAAFALPALGTNAPSTPALGLRFDF